MPKKQNKQTKDAGSGSGYLWSMSHAPKIDQDTGLAQTLPLIFFTAIIITFARLHFYDMPLDQFYWGGRFQSADFFSYYKMVAIVACAIVTVLLFIYRLTTQTFAIKKTFLYIPILIYSLFVILSYVYSEYKEFALWGFRERFEGTVIILSYMVMLVYAINTINSEKNIKFILYPVAASSALLGFLGISQAIGNDFFRTKLGGMLITPPSFWASLDTLEFNFAIGQIYQTVYNLNYVSFYLTLLIPIFGFLFIYTVLKGKSEKSYKKIIWGALFALALFNLVGSASIGGALGLGISVIAAVAIFNKKLFVDWRKPVIMLLATGIIVVGAFGHQHWLPKIGQTIGSVITPPAENSGQPGTEGAVRSHIDYIEVFSEEELINISVNGNELTFMLPSEHWPEFYVIDANGQSIDLVSSGNEGEYFLEDDRFDMFRAGTATSSEGIDYFMVEIDEYIWLFLATDRGVFFINDRGNITEMKKIEAIGFANNPGFGSGRGYIWSRTLPMMRDTFFIGHGADTYTLYFPHNDYTGKYNAGWDINLLVDKPHNMYMHMAVGTGGVSLLAFLALLALYFVQSVKIYWRRSFKEFADFAGAGIFIGILGFAFAGLVNDSSVSVMPLFYGLLGTGIAANIMLIRKC